MGEIYFDPTDAAPTFFMKLDVMLLFQVYSLKSQTQTSSSRIC